MEGNWNVRRILSSYNLWDYCRSYKRGLIGLAYEFSQKERKTISNYMML